MYVADHMFNSDINFMVEPQIHFSFTHSFPRIYSKKEYGFRIFVTDNDPVSIASIYKKQISDEGGIVTLAEKAKSNSNIEKLYGAPHIYLWDKSFISDSNMKWPQLKNAMKDDTFAWIKKLASTKLEMGKEAVVELEKVRNQDYADKYQKRIITQMFNELLKLREFYNPTVFKTLDDPASQDRQVQMTAYGDDLKVITNFSKQDFTYEGKVVKASSLIIIDGDKEIVYQ